jgi:prepilin-type N-terminal cleavage/methylation domain-containing protein
LVKRGFGLIELIIAIVVIAISVISLPIMVTQANKSDEDAINQDVFFHCMIVMNDIGSRFWDGSISAQDTAGNRALIADVQNGAGRINATSNYRVGHFQRATGDMRKFYDYNTPINATAIPLATSMRASYDTIEDYNGYTLDLTGDTNINTRFVVAVDYVTGDCTTSGSKDICTWNLSGMPSSQTTDIKRAVVTAVKTYGSQTMSVSYSSFFSNIGNVDIRSK